MKKAKAKSKPAVRKSTRAVAKPKVPEQLQTEQDADREAVLDEREKLSRQFPQRYAADVGIFPGGKVEVMLRLSYSEAEGLARLLQQNKL